MSAMDTVRGVFTNPTAKKSMIAGAAMGGGLTLLGSGMSRGGTPPPSADGVIASGIQRTVIMAALNAGIGAFMAPSNKGAAALQGAKFGAFLAIGWTAGSAVAQGTAAVAGF